MNVPQNLWRPQEKKKIHILQQLERKLWKIEDSLGTQIGMFRPIRMDHTNCLQVAIKTLQLPNFLND
jgi:hypothetical protein